VGESHMARVVLTVPEMSCTHCVQTVTAALSPLAGITDVSVDLTAKTVRVAYDPAHVTVETMRDVLAGEDYPVAGVTTS
jgi:copper chaperone